MLDATCCGLPCEEIIKMLEVLQSHIDERRKAINEKLLQKKRRRLRKTGGSALSLSSSATSATFPSEGASSVCLSSSTSSVVDPSRATELEESDLRVLFMGRLFDNSFGNTNNSSNALQNSSGSLNVADKKREKREEQFLALFLTHLNLSKNSIGYFPREICRPVDGLGSRLTHLNLSHNNIEYHPPSIRTLKFLETFELSGNKLIAIPKEIGDLASLTFLGLEGNCIRYLPFQILSLGRSTLSITVDNNPWLQPGQLHNINECLRDRALFPPPSSSNANAHNNPAANAATDNEQTTREGLHFLYYSLPLPSFLILHLSNHFYL